MDRSVYITGVGVVSPAGIDTAANWRRLAGGERCVGLLDDPELTGGGAVPAGLVGDFQPPRGTEDLDRVCQLAVCAAEQAVVAADLRGVSCGPADPARLAVSFGTSKGGILSFHQALARLDCGACPDLHLSQESPPSDKRFLALQPSRGNNIYREPLRTVKSLHGDNRRYLCAPAEPSGYLFNLLACIPPDAPARFIARRLGASGGAHATVAACATGTLAIIRAVQMIADRQADVVVAGSADASLHALWFAAFRQMGVLATSHPVLGPSWACRPFDANRSGFVVGEGAAALVLESADSVRRRAVRPLARIAGYAMGTDPAGLTRLEQDGAPLSRIAEIACSRAAVSPSELVAVQAHGTGTITNDPVEVNAVRRLCGPRTRDLPIVSLKGTLGHLLGAAGSVELALAVSAAARGILPPNSTLLEADPGLGPLTLPTEPMDIPPGPILKTSMGFGGHLAAVLIAPA